MKNIALLLALLLGFAGHVSAQIGVDVVLGQDQFIPGEPLLVKARVSNNSGQTIHFGDEAWLSYGIEASDGSVVIKTSEVPIAHNLDVKASEWISVRGDLAPCFRLDKPGRYKVTATVQIKDWQSKMSSKPSYFELLQGTRMWDQAFGVPRAAADQDGPPEIRKYILQRVTLEREMKLYFRLTDVNEVRSLKVFPIGPMLSFSDPQMRVDQASNLHLLYQSGARAYSYLVINPDGQVALRQSYVYETSAPHLKVDESGNALIVGGMRRLADNDVPSTRTSSLTNDIPLPVR